jgi:hypothetical protein
MKRYFLLILSLTMFISCSNTDAEEKRMIQLFETHLQYLKQYNLELTELLKTGKLTDNNKKRISHVHKNYAQTGISMDILFKKKVRVSEGTYNRIEIIKKETREVLKTHLNISEKAFKIPGAEVFFEKLLLDNS